MIRHMDAAWEVRGGKRVLGLMIVEGEGGQHATVPTGHWLNQANEQVAEHTLSDSLPHRAADERQQMARGSRCDDVAEGVCRVWFALATGRGGSSRCRVLG